MACARPNASRRGGEPVGCPMSQRRSSRPSLPSSLRGARSRADHRRPLANSPPIALLSPAVRPSSRTRCGSWEESRCGYLCRPGMNELSGAKPLQVADLERRSPRPGSPKWRIGSVSKPLTAAAVGVCWTRGAATDLDIPGQTCVPDFPAKPVAITAWQLHAGPSGWNPALPGQSSSTCTTRSPGVALSIFAGDSLLFEPGTPVSSIAPIGCTVGRLSKGAEACPSPSS